MSESEDPPVDLTPLTDHARWRAGRIESRVMQQIAASYSVRARLAGAALPALLAAAASVAVLLLTRPREAEPDRFALLVVGPGPARSWVTLNRAPDLQEVRAMLGGIP
jgi:hypothetical protein